jgi:hypothetical protein
MKNILLGTWMLAFAVYAKAQTSPARNKTDFKPYFEKVYLHTDRDVYALGDTLWFKAYLVNAQNNKPAASSGNLYAELISTDSSRIVMRETIRLENGLGKGDMPLGDSIKAGHYRLRAYTNWMRNFGDNFVFEKDITLLDARVSGSSGSSSKQVYDKNKGSATATGIPTIHFFPEGGSLVEGISAIVGVKAEDITGKGVPVSGVVLSASGDTISHFSCDSLGLGLFAILPIAGQTYYAMANKTRFEFPKALSKGPTLQIRQSDSIIHAIVSISEDPASLTVKPRYTLEVKHGGQAVISQALQVNEKQLSVNIPITTLPEGISAVTLYDDQNKPECERLVYIHHPDTKNSAGIATNKKVYRPKEQVTVNISTQPNSTLSMAVVDANMAPVKAANIVSYLNLQSEIRGNIEQANRYFDTTNVNRFKELDKLLLTQGWRNFVWRRLADTAIRISYAAENGITVAGEVKDENRNKPLPDLNMSLFATGAVGNKIFSAKSDSSGRFTFHDLMLYGDQNIKLAALNDKGQSKGAITIDTIPALLIGRAVQPTAAQALIDSAADVALEKKTAQMKASGVRGITRLKEVNISDAKTKSRAVILNNGNAYSSWGTNQTLNITPDDYQYKTLSWFLVQKGKGAFPDSKGSGVVFLADRNRKVAPILFINGVQAFGADRNLYFDMPIDKFKSVTIKEVAQAAFKMPLRYLLYLTLKDNYLIDNPGSLSLNVTGYYNARDFYKPVPSARPALADYRTTIDWEPNIKTDNTGHAAVSFYNGNLQGNVQVILQGISNTGTPVAVTAGYEIR